MTAREFLAQIIDPGMAFLAYALGPNDGAAASTPALRTLLLSTAGQESDWKYRRQIGGPARGFWQYEKAGALRGVMRHVATQARVKRLTDALCIHLDEGSLFEAIAWNDHLATAFARLLLWTDAAPVPSMGEEQIAWAYYLRNWRPGKPRPQAWPGIYQQACEAVQSSIAIPRP
jgi:hypothetical protein